MSHFSAIISRARNLGERGASGVEYSLVVALVLVGSSASLEMMDERVEGHYSETAHDIGQNDLDYFDPTTTLCELCPTTTTTLAPTTTLPPTTTVAPTAATLSSSNNTSGYNSSTRKWNVDGRIRLKNSAGADIVSATVTYTIRLANGQSATYTGTTNSNGRVTVSWTNISGSSVLPATITITSVTKNGITYAPTPSSVVFATTT